MNTTILTRAGRRLARATPLLLLAIGWQAAMGEPSDQGAVEYFINQDPGPGNGTLVEVDDGRVSFTANFGPLPPGTHSLYLRVRSDEGVWGPALPYTFAVEYAWNADAGNPQWSRVDLNDPQPAGRNIAFDAMGTDLPLGTQVLVIRTIDSSGDAGLPVLTSVAIVPPSLIGHPPAADKLVVFAEDAGGMIPGSRIELPLGTHVPPDSSHVVTLPLAGGAPGAARVVAYVRSVTGDTGPHAATAFSLVVNGTNGYTAWLAGGGRFTPQEIADPAISGMRADPDRDGITYDLEFAFGTHPRQASNLMLPHSIIENGRLVFRFRKGSDVKKIFLELRLTMMWQEVRQSPPRRP